MASITETVYARVKDEDVTDRMLDAIGTPRPLGSGGCASSRGDRGLRHQMGMPNAKPLACLLALVLAACVAPDGGEEPPVGVAQEAVNDCMKQCYAFATEGCRDIQQQCDDQDDDNGQRGFAFAGAYVTTCPTAIHLACGGVKELRQCLTETCRFAH